MRKTIIGCRLSPFIVMILVCSLAIIPAISAENTPLTEKNIKDYAPNTIGVVGRGYDVIMIGENDYGNTIKASVTVTLWNTMPIDAPLKTYVGRFSGTEREHPKVQENYTFYHIPDLNWVLVNPSEFTLKSMHKYKVQVNVEMAKDEAFEKAKTGGFIFLVGFEPDTSEGVSGAGLQLTPAMKIFVFMQKNASFKEGFDIGTTSIILIGSGGALIIGGIAFGVIKKRKDDEQIKKYLSKQKRSQSK